MPLIVTIANYPPARDLLSRFFGRNNSIMTKTERVLRDAADLIERTGWTQHASARNAKGDPCTFLNNYAAQFCLTGAINRVTGDDWRTAGIAMRIMLDTGSIDTSPISWNDDPERTEAEVTFALRKTADWAAAHS